MTNPESGPRPTSFSFNAYSPAEIEEAIEKLGITKANLPFVPCFMLGIVAGAGIGLGALYFSIVASDANLSFAITRVLGGLVFCLGLAIVLVGGAELFTGDNLIVMAWASGRISARQVLRNWIIVYCGNFVGSVGLAGIVLYSHHLDMNGDRIALTMLNTAVAKISPDPGTCLAVWLAAAGRSVTDKIIALILPISAFVATGFEHSVANMYFPPLAWLLKVNGNVPAGFDASLITIPGIIHNLVPVTLGNIVGGAGLVGFTYWVIYREGLGALQAKLRISCRGVLAWTVALFSRPS